MEKDRIALFALRFKLKSKFRCKTYSTKLDIYSIWVRVYWQLSNRFYWWFRRTKLWEDTQLGIILAHKRSLIKDNIIIINRVSSKSFPSADSSLFVVYLFFKRPISQAIKTETDTVIPLPTYEINDYS
jgi:hypothetical protein